MRTRLLGAAILALVSTAGAQESVVRVVVSDSIGARIPFAVVMYKDGVSRAANDSGVALVEVATLDSVRLVVRRMGFLPSEGWVPPGSGARVYAVTLRRLPQRLKEVAIRAPGDNRLFRAGFYERMDDRTKISTNTRFFTPEELDMRNADQVSSILAAVPFLTIRYMSEVGGPTRMLGRKVPVITGRGRCPATILLDGQVPKGLYEDFASEDRNPITANVTPIPFDDLVRPGSITGIEVYQSASGAPAELRIKVTRPNCPLVALWTGPRQ